MLSGAFLIKEGCTLHCSTLLASIASFVLSCAAASMSFYQLQLLSAYSNVVAADLQQLLGDFELDLEAVVPIKWKHMIGSGSTAQGADGSSHAADAALLARGKLQSRLLDLTSSNRAAAFAAGGGAVSAGASAALPVVWAHKLDAVLAVLRLAVEEWGRAADSSHGSSRRAELLGSNVEEV
jgi:hypothetical protein